MDVPLQKQMPDAETRLRDLKIVLDGDIRYQLDQLFPRLTGWGANGDIKRRATLIKAVELYLKLILFDGEEVQYVAKATLYTFIATNVRLLMTMATDIGRTSEGMFWSVYYSEIESLDGARWLSDPMIRLKDKKTIRLSGMSVDDVIAMQSIYRASIAEYHRLEISPAVSQSRETLCRRCYVVVPKGQFVCGACDAEYWTPGEIAVRTVIFPVWGHYCMGHRWFILAESMEYLGIWLYAIEMLKFNLVQGLTRIMWILIFQHGVVAAITWVGCLNCLYFRSKSRSSRAVEPEAGNDTESMF